MDRATSERWVTISALIVAGIYGYRRLTEATSTPVTLKKIAGIGNPVPLGAFATAWGFTYLVVAIMAEAMPGVGGAFAILIAVGDFLTNSQSVFKDVTSLEKPSSGLQSVGQLLSSAAGTQQLAAQTSVGGGLSGLPLPSTTAALNIIGSGLGSPSPSSTVGLGLGNVGLGSVGAPPLHETIPLGAPLTTPGDPVGSGLSKIGAL